jgi:hypothetical protein
MNEERRQILDMLAQGKLNVEEAERLLRAVDGGGPGAVAPAAAAETHAAKLRPRFLRVLVTHGEVEHVNVRVPIGVLRAGVKLGAVLPDSVRAEFESQAHGRMNRGDIPFDLSKLSGDNIDDFIAALSDEGIEVMAGDGADHVHIRVFCE